MSLHCFVDTSCWIVFLNKIGLADSPFFEWVANGDRIFNSLTIL